MLWQLLQRELIRNIILLCREVNAFYLKTINAVVGSIELGRNDKSKEVSLSVSS